MSSHPPHLRQFSAMLMLCVLAVASVAAATCPACLKLEFPSSHRFAFSSADHDSEPNCDRDGCSCCGFQIIASPPDPVALGMTRHWLAPGGISLDVAPFVVALEHATGHKALAFKAVGTPAKTSRKSFGSPAACPGSGRDAVTRISAAVCCIGCRHCYLLQPNYYRSNNRK